VNSSANGIVLLDCGATNKGAVAIEVLECLQKYGQRLDLEIARETGIPLAAVRERLADLVATGAVIKCDLTRFEHGKRIEAWQCRVAGYHPPPAPGRKPKAST
jgi:predicted ArsR family transcriptional regulator